MDAIQIRHDGARATLTRDVSKGIPYVPMLLITGSSSVGIVAILLLVLFAGLNAYPPILGVIALFYVMLAVTSFGGFGYSLIMALPQWREIDVAVNPMALVAVHSWRGRAYRTDIVPLKDLRFCKVAGQSLTVAAGDDIIELPADGTPIAELHQLAEAIEEAAKRPYEPDVVEPPEALLAMLRDQR